MKLQEINLTKNINAYIWYSENINNTYLLGCQDFINHRYGICCCFSWTSSCPGKDVLTLQSQRYCFFLDEFWLCPAKTSNRLNEQNRPTRRLITKTRFFCGCKYEKLIFFLATKRLSFTQYQWQPQKCLMVCLLNGSECLVLTSSTFSNSNTK